MSAAWAGVIVAGLAAVVTVLGLVTAGHRRKLRRESRIALGPDATELRRQLLRLRDLFGDIVAEGGVDHSWFVAENRKKAGDDLREQAKRVGDPELKQCAGHAARSWDAAFAQSPPSRGPRVYNLGAPPDPIYLQQDAVEQQRRQKVVDAAALGQEQCASAISRLNQLEAAAPEP
jgi:hypothetical protein